MRRLTIDAVLTFLTSNITHSGYESYLTYSTPAVTQPASQEESSEGDYIADTLVDDIYDPNYTDTPSGE